MLQVKAKILRNKKIKDNYWHCVLACGVIAKKASAGQFVNIKITEGLNPFLRRPFSIHRVNGASIEILYEVLGPGTKILAKQKAGNFLDIIGPLGNGFDFRSPGHQVTRSPVLVTGGMGVAPLIFLAEKLAKLKPLVLIGARTKKQILCEKEFKDLGLDVKIATDDGSQGFKGKVTDLLKKILPLAISDKRLAIYACGPRPMLKEISHISKQYGIPAQISLEEHLACGIGACLGCVVKTRQGYQRVCKEGPVFNADEIVW